jgi:hypothetical protein
MALMAPCLVQSSASASTVLSSIMEEKKDPNLQEVSFDLGYGPEYFEVYIDTDIKTMSQGKYDTVIQPKMNGHAVKFFNMSPQFVQLYW